MQRVSWKKRLVETEGELEEEVGECRGSVGRRGWWMQRVSWNWKKRLVDTEGQLGRRGWWIHRVSWKKS